MTELFLERIDYELGQRLKQHCNNSIDSHIKQHKYCSVSIKTIENYQPILEFRDKCKEYLLKL